MKLLLDTHVLLWLLGEPSRIPATTLTTVRDTANELFVSAVTSFEIATKHRIGKFPEGERVILAYDDHLRELGARDLPVTAHHGTIAGQLHWDHRDPFDRLLAAQSLAENMPIVTADAAFDSLGGIRTLWA